MIVIIFLGSTKWYSYEQQYFDFKTSQRIADLKKLNLSVYSIDPTGLPTIWYLANDLYQKQRYNAAIKNYQLALKHNPHHVHVLNNMGSAYLNLGKVELAKQSYQKALDLNPIFTETLMNYASLEYNNGNIDGALGKILQVVIDKEPPNYKLYITVIGQAKMEWLVDLYDEPVFENFLKSYFHNNDFIYQISLNARTTGASFEDELRKFCSQKNDDQ